MQRLRNEPDIDRLRRSAHAYAVLSAWSGAGLFEALRDGEPRRPSELPANARAIEATAPVLGHLGLLVRDGDRWGLSQTGAEMLEAGSPRSSRPAASCCSRT